MILECSNRIISLSWLSDFVQTKKYSMKDLGSRIPLADPKKVVNFKDKGFEKAIRELYQLEDEILWEDIGYREELVFVDFIREDTQDIYNIQLTEKINSIEDVKWFVNVVDLRVNFGDPSRPWIYGELKDILSLERLKKLDLSGAIIQGDISLLKDHCNLDEITLTGLEVEGELKVLKHLTNLKCLYICDTQVTGSLKDISQLRQLKTLVLSISEIGGNLSDLNNLVNLEELSIGDSYIEGDISSLNHLEKLKYLELYDLEIEGDLSSIQHLKNLKELDLGGTYVKGSLNDLKEMKVLRELSLNDAEIGGDISLLSKFKELRKLDLSDSEVKGNAQVLQQLKHLKDYDISNTDTARAISDELENMEAEKQGIEKENAHPRAVELIPEDFFWNTTDELSLFGSENGDTAVRAYRKWREGYPYSNTIEYFNWVVQNVFEQEVSEYNIDLLDEKLIRSQVENKDFDDTQYVYGLDITVIAMGFTQLIDEGIIDNENKPLIQLAIDRQKIWGKLQKDWKHSEEYIQNLNVLDRVLKIA